MPHACTQMRLCPGVRALEYNDPRQYDQHVAGCLRDRRGEFYLQADSQNFRDTFNSQHRQFRNQVSKLTYVPDLSGNKQQHWWEWLDNASRFFSVIGDKMAFSAHQFELMAPENIQAFFEARFFAARYVFVIRDPTATLLSVARLLGLTDDGSLRMQMDAWLQFIQFWADFVRIFPNTLTLLKVTEPETTQLQRFLGITLENAQHLYNTDLIRSHKLAPEFSLLEEMGDDLAAIFRHVGLSLDCNRAVWQKEQKRSLEENDTLRRVDAATLVAPTPIGQVWALAEALRKKLHGYRALGEELPIQ